MHVVRIGEPHHIEPPPADEWARRSYPSPNGGFTLAFSEGSEYAMGASCWKAKLVGPKGKGTKLPYALAVAPLAPWSPDGGAFAYPATKKLREDGRLLLGHVGKGIRWPIVPTWPEGIFWSPKRAALPVIGKGWFSLLDREGRITASREWSVHARDPVYANWFASGERFFVIGRSPGRKVTFREYDANGGALGEEPLDPADLVPFDAQAFASLDREVFSLRTAPGTRSIAGLLDRWCDARYDAASGDLRLAVYRPTGPVEPEPSAAFGMPAGTLTAPASVQWIAVRITE